MSISPTIAREFIAVKSPDESLPEHNFDLLSECKSVHVHSGCQTTVLFAMFVGQCSDNGRRLGDTDAGPHKDMKFRKHLVPVSKHS